VRANHEKIIKIGHAQIARAVQEVAAAVGERGTDVGRAEQKDSSSR
jgi:hypothetical protein